jgi:Zn-finger protein
MGFDVSEVVLVMEMEWSERKVPFYPCTYGQATESVSNYRGDEVSSCLTHACIGSDLKVKRYQKHELENSF